MYADHALVLNELARLAVERPELVMEKLEVVVGLWGRFGRAMNLVGSTDERVLWGHVREALLCLEVLGSVGVVDTGRGWVDVGSGAGLPGLVLSCVLDGGILVEPRRKRAEFLEMAVKRLGLGTVVRCQRVEELGGVEVDWVTARAVFEPTEFVRVGAGLVREGGLVIVHSRSGGKIDCGGRLLCSAEWADWWVLAFEV